MPATQYAGTVTAPVARAPFSTPTAYDGQYVSLPPRFTTPNIRPWVGGTAGLLFQGPNNDMALADGGVILARPTGFVQIKSPAPTLIGSRNYRALTAGNVMTPLDNIPTPQAYWTITVPDAVGIYSTSIAQKRTGSVDSTFFNYRMETAASGSNFTTVPTFLAGGGPDPENRRMDQWRWDGTTYVKKNFFNTEPQGVSGLMQAVDPAHWAVCQQGGTCHIFLGNGTNHGPMYSPAQTLDISNNTLSTYPILSWRAISFDNAAINTAFLALNFNCAPYKGGFIFCFFTNGAGPTGQKCELAFVDPGMTRYTLIKWSYQDAFSKAVFAGGPPAQGWTARIDDGFMYVGPGVTGDDFLYMVNMASILGGTLDTSNCPPIKLPCLFTCNPIAP